jgi:hypothetical protein
MQDFQQFMQSMGSPSQFQQTGMQDLLKAVKATVDAALEFADAVAQAFLNFVYEALQSTDSILNYAMDIPLLSWLFQKYTGQQLTALNVFTLLAAAPVTIVYKLMGGGRYLFTDAQVQEITCEPGAKTDIDPSVITAFAYCAAGLNLAWGIFDTCLDALQAAPPIGLQILDIVFPALVQIFSWPGGVPMIVSLKTPAENWGFGNWMVSWSPIALNLALILVGTLGTVAAEDARYMDGLGQGLLTGLGLLNLGIGAAASALGQKDGSVGTAGVVANTLGPLPCLFQFLRIEAFEELTETVSFFIKLFLDFFCGLGTSVALFLAGSSSLAVTGAA